MKPLLLLLLLICVTDLARNQSLMFLLKVVKTRKLGKMECMKFGAVNIYMVKEKGIIMKTTITTTTNSTRNLQKIESISYYSRKMGRNLNQAAHNVINGPNIFNRFELVIETLQKTASKKQCYLKSSLFHLLISSNDRK